MPIFNPTSIIGTANQVAANGVTGLAETGIVTLTLPQDIASSSSPSFTALTLSGLSQNSFIYPTTGGLLTSTSAATNGQILIGSTASAPVKTTLTQGAGVTVTNGPGSITISNAGVLSFSGGTTGLTPAVGTTGAITLAGTLIATNGGTGQSIYTIGDILYAGSTTTLAKLPADTSGNALLSSGTGTAPMWGKIGLTTHVTGALPITNGGTGVTSVPASGQLLIGNGSTYSTATLTSGAGISITNGAGSITINALNNGTVTSVAASGGSTGLSFTGSPITTTGTLTLTGTLNAANGGTGQSLYTVGDILFANTTTTLGKLADIASGNVLRSGGVGLAPDWGKVVLTTHVTGTLPITNGGTNLTTLGAPLEILRVNALGTALEYATFTAGTVTSVATVQPASGLTISGSPITTNGTFTFALANDLAAVEALATTGIATRTGVDAWTTRSITGTANTITVANGNGVAGSPTITIADNPVLPGTASVQIPSGTTAQRPASPVNGMIRYNTSLDRYESWVVDKWLGIAFFGSNYVINSYRGNIPAAAGTTSVNYDNTAPLITEGTQVWETTITPLSASSSLEIDLACTVDLSSNNRVLIASLFRGSVNIGSAMFYSTGGARPNTLAMSISDSPGVTSPTTYSWRVGVGNGSATWYVNSTSSGNNLAGRLESEWNIKEVI